MHPHSLTSVLLYIFILCSVHGSLFCLYGGITTLLVMQVNIVIIMTIIFNNFCLVILECVKKDAGCNLISHLSHEFCLNYWLVLWEYLHNIDLP